MLIIFKDKPESIMLIRKLIFVIDCYIYGVEKSFCYTVKSKNIMQHTAFKLNYRSIIYIANM